MIFNYVDGLPKPTDKFGSIPVQAGINSKNNFVSISNATDVSRTSNVDIPGVWIFQTNGRNFTEPSKIEINR